MLKKNKMYLFLFVLAIVTAVGFQGWRTLLNNFAVDIAGVSGLEMGIIQSVREIPGFLALLVIYLLLFISEHRLAALSVGLLGLGIGLTGMFPSFYGLAACTLLMSFGFHYYETVNQSLTLQYFSIKKAPIVFGRLRAMSAVANIVTGAVIFMISGVMSYKAMFIMFGVFVFCGAVWAGMQNPTDENIVPQHKKMILKRRYWLYYLLTFLSGARRQIFIAFAVFLLVLKFEFTIREITILFVVNNVIAMFANPMIGKAVNKFGERKVLTLEYTSLIVVFLCYAFSESKLLVAAMYIVDHLVFNFAMAIRTYFQKIADPEDIAPSMAVGFTINHIAAVVIPALGGLAWVGHPSWVFVGGACMSFVSLVFVQFIRTPVPAGSTGN